MRYPEIPLPGGIARVRCTQPLSNLQSGRIGFQGAGEVSLGYANIAQFIVAYIEAPLPGSITRCSSMQVALFFGQIMTLGNTAVFMEKWS